MAPEPDYASLGLKCGLEIHQQLDTPKLFCRCASVLDEGVDVTVRRELRPTASELGEIDPAALAEARKGLVFRYEASRGSSCLVELDDEPPHPMSAEAVDVALTIATLFEMRPEDEVHVMRKIVIDGSNTGGFQRTSLLATGGVVKAEGGDVTLQSLCLEEDSARRMGETEAAGKGNAHAGARVVTFRLDRLGIPLVEIATDPTIRSPLHAREVAEAIGMTLRATGRVKRGLGTIRQDLNVSIRDGARVELKGVQNLDVIADAVRYEVLRQLRLVAVRDTLASRGIDAASIPGAFVDVAEAFAGTTSKVLASTLKKGGAILALKLPGFAGLLGPDPEAPAPTSKDAAPPPRLGRELADHAKVAAGVGGLFHTDELPAYGVTREEVDAVRALLGLAREDAFALVAAPRERAERALEAVAERARTATLGVPEETREVQLDGSSRYLRPLPGGARMYPETDVPPLTVRDDHLERIRANLPELIPERIERMKREHGIHHEQARVLARSGRADVFERIARETGLAKEAARALDASWTELEREGVDVDALDDERVLALFRALAAGKFAKEAVPDLMRHLASKGGSVDDAVEALGLAGASEEEVVAILDRLIEAQRDFIVAKGGMGALGGLMGSVMKELRGKVDGGTLNRLLRERLGAFVEREGIGG